ncbi:MAG: peptidase MA family metallohydrolase [Fuerstiella sp.]
MLHMLQYLPFLPVLICTVTVQAATISDCQQMLQQGDYVGCLDATTEAIRRRSYGEDWPVLKAAAETQLGRYLQAAETLDEGIVRYTWSIRLRMQRYDVSQILGDREAAERMLDEIDRVATSAPWRYTDADDLVALGRAAIVLGADPKDVLEGFFDRARKNYQNRPDGYLAAGQLAIEKGDFALAAELLRPAVEKFPDNTDICFALATAVQSAEPERAAELLDHTLTLNPQYLPTLQHLAERQIDAEDYTEAAATIAKIHEINPWHPESHALQAVIHHLLNEPQAEARSRSAALAFSTANPAVDFLIGQKLSRKYRFAEAARYQQQALQTDPQFLPARTQLAQDLLRLGQDERGWAMAEEAQNQDRYDTTLFNLLQLKDSLDNFATRRTDHFVIRMDQQESAVYGQQVEDLLSRAFETLSARYGYTPAEPIVVEIFDRPDDFAVRTFGIPDVAGFLGVCFGRVITANSPASQRNSPNNWQSVLWHEFCHVITLQMTGNRIPRWLSEGISVYEERQVDQRWGQSMTPAFRQRAQDGNITPVSRLSSAFLKAESGEDLNFAYYESSMVVEFLIEKHGFESLKAILNDLNQGLTINDALDRHAGGLTELDAAFEVWLTGVAERYASGVEFSVQRPNAEASPPDLIELAGSNPAHYTAGLRLALNLIRAEKLEQAAQKLEQLVELFPEDASPGGARRMLAEVYRRQNQPDRQAEVLAAHLMRSADDLEAALQLLELQVAAGQWQQATETGRLVMAIDPLQPAALRTIYQAAAQVAQEDLAIAALNGLLQLDPADAARTRFQLARMLRATDRGAARRHILLALEQAPRYRDAHRLLLELSADETSPDKLPSESREPLR